MIIDQSRYDAFWANPEKFRMTYLLNKVSRTPAYGLQRGIAFHTIADCTAAGMSDCEIQEILEGLKSAPRGETLILSKDAIEMAWVLWREVQRQFPVGCGIEKIAHEIEFDYEIPGSRHHMAGRIDEILTRHEQVWCGELKTAYNRANFDRIVLDWETKSQADFEIIGARSLEFPVEGVYVRTVVETTPPKIWPLEVRRSDNRLATKILNVHQTCEIIEMLVQTFGIERPWPHHSFAYPCSSPGKCEYETICGRALADLTAEDLAPFKQREEHLLVIKNSLKAEGADEI